jgi:hypothetical protein
MDAIACTCVQAADAQKKAEAAERRAAAAAAKHQYGGEKEPLARQVSVAAGARGEHTAVEAAESVHLDGSE